MTFLREPINLSFRIFMSQSSGFTNISLTFPRIIMAIYATRALLQARKYPSNLKAFFRMRFEHGKMMRKIFPDQGIL